MGSSNLQLGLSFGAVLLVGLLQYLEIGLRWRTEKEVISGKVGIRTDSNPLIVGTVVCGNKHCDRKDNLSSYEVKFSYIEAGENKQALVKLVACERDRSESDEDTEIDHGRSKDRRKEPFQEWINHIWMVHQHNEAEALPV